MTANQDMRQQVINHWNSPQTQPQMLQNLSQTLSYFGLNADEQKVFILEQNGIPLIQIAKEMNQAEQYVQNNLNSAKQKVQNGLNR